MTIINGNEMIDTPMELLIVVLLTFVFLIILCKLGAMLEKLPVPQPKSKAKKKEVVKEVKKEVKKDIKKEVVKDIKEASVQKDSSTTISQNESITTSTSSSSTASASTNNGYSAGGCGTGGYVCPYSNVVVQGNVYPNNDNYLYDRFAVSPTREDYFEEKRISDAFIDESELDSIRNRNVSIHVNSVDSAIGTKERLHQRISQMTSQNQATRERLLEEFEGLSREMKLLIIDNIMQKM